MSTPPQRRTQLIGGLTFSLVALLLGLAFAYPRQLTRGFLINDEAWYAEPARNIAHGEGFVTDTLYPMFAAEVDSLPMGEPFKQIGFPFVAALVGQVAGFSDQLFVLIALVGFCLTGLTTWLVALRLLRHPRAAAGVTLATIGNPVLWSWWTAALPESLFTAIFLAGIWLLLHDSLWTRGGAGAALALSVYFKGFAVLAFPLALGYLWLGEASWRARLRPCAAFVAGAGLGVALMTAVTPSGTAQISGSSDRYAGSMLLYETRGAYPQHEGPFYDVTPLDPLTYVFENPLDYAEKVARMVSRTKAIVESLGGPAFGGVLLPMLLLVTLSVGFSVVTSLTRRPVSARDGTAQDTNQLPVRLLLVGLIAVHFLFFWAGNFKERYFAHLFPLMLAAAVLEFERLHSWTWRRGSWVVASVAVGYFLVMPPAIGLWRAYRQPNAYLGRMLAGRWADYQEVAATVTANVSEDGMVMSDMAHEISWYADRQTVFFPGAADQFDYLVDKFDVRALYEHPQGPRSWPVIHERFELVDERNGRFWLRRETPGRANQTSTR